VKDRLPDRQKRTKLRTGLTPEPRHLVKKRTKYYTGTYERTGQVELMRTNKKIKTIIDHPLKTHERFYILEAVFRIRN